MTMRVWDGSRRLFLGAAGSAVAAPMLARAVGHRDLDIRILVGEDGAATSEILKAFLARFPAARVVQSPAPASDHRTGQIYVALGAAALQAAVMSGTPTPVLALFTSNEAYTRVVNGAERRPGYLSALFAEASPVQQLKLARTLYKRRIGVIVLFSAATVHLQPLVEDAAEASDVELHARVLNADDNVVRALLDQRDAQAVLMIPDRRLYTADNLRNVLESTYRRQLGVIGFSPSLVRAGALAAAYSTIEDVLAQARTIIESLAVGRTLAAQYPVYWRVLINERVANSLDVVVEDADRGLGNIPGKI